jgi:hypothetical protein
MREEGGKIIPEVGDVWFNEQSKQKFVVLDFNPTSNDFIAYNLKTKTMRLFDASTPVPSQFKYLGRSKATINQLFEVE